MLWLVFALVSVCALSVATILQRKLLKDEKSDSHVYAIAFQLGCAALVAVYAFIHGFSLPQFLSMPWNFLLMAVLYGSGTWLLFRALKTTEASEVTIVTSIRAVVTVLSAILFLHEPFGLMRAFGMLLVLGSVILVSWHGEKVRFSKGTLFSLGMAVCYGLAVTNDAFILKTADPLSYTAVSFLLPGLFLVITKPTALKKLPLLFTKKLFWKIALMCLIYSTASIAFYLALSVGAPASQLGPINQMSVVFTVLLASLFLNERENIGRKILAALLAVAGVLLLA